MIKLEGCIALVTGANRGLGNHFVQELIGFGAHKVYACARNPAMLDPLTKENGQRVVPLHLDVTDAQSIAAATTTASDLTLLINNAGVFEERGLMEAGSTEGLKREMAVNLYGAAEMCLAFAPVLARNGGGAIMNMLSIAGVVHFPPFGTYAASKAAAISLTKSLRYELAGQGTLVAGVIAGFIATGMADDLNVEKADPISVVRESLQGIENGLEDIDADDRSKEIRAALGPGPKAIEEVTWERARDFRTANPLDE